MNNHKQHYHYTIQGYNRISKKGDLFHDVSEISVYTTSEKDALARAKLIIKKKHYRISKAWECFEDHLLKEEILMTQLEVQTKMLKQLS